MGSVPALEIARAYGATRTPEFRKLNEMGERIFRLMLATASGQQTKSERHGYGQNEFVPWQLGAVM